MAAPVPWRRSLTSTCKSSSPGWCSWPSIYLPLSLPAHRQPLGRRASPTSSIRDTQAQAHTEWQSCDLATAYVCASPRPHACTSSSSLHLVLMLAPRPRACAEVSAAHRLPPVAPLD